MRTFQHNRPDGLDFICEPFTTPQGRYYRTPSGNLYASASTVVSSLNEKGLTAWKNRVGEDEANKIARAAANRGTALHTVCESYLKNELTPMHLMGMMPSIKQLFLQVRPIIDQMVSSVYCVEQVLYSDSLRLAGRTDGACIWEHDSSIIDFKTSRKYKQESYVYHYFLQTTAYAIMFRERTGIPIDQIVLVIAVEEESIPQVLVRSISSYTSKLSEVIDNHYSLYPATV